MVLRKSSRSWTTTPRSNRKPGGRAGQRPLPKSTNLPQRYKPSSNRCPRRRREPGTGVPALRWQTRNVAPPVVEEAVQAACDERPAAITSENEGADEADDSEVPATLQVEALRILPPDDSDLIVILDAEAHIAQLSRTAGKRTARSTANCLRNSAGTEGQDVSTPTPGHWRRRPGRFPHP